MIYRNIYFRLESGYEWGKGLDENKSITFRDEITTLFKNAGWDIKESKSLSSSPNAIKDKNRLYLHPMSVSGELQEDLITEVENILSYGQTFKHYKTDLYEALQDIYDNEYQQYLESKKEFIKQDLLDGFTTKRKNLFISSPSSVIEKVKEKYRIQRIQEHIGRSSSNLEWKYVAEVFDELVESNCFISANTKYGVGYRAKTKQELKVTV